MRNIVEYFGYNGTVAEPLGCTLKESRFHAKLLGYKRCHKCSEFVVKVNNVCPVCLMQERDKAFIASLK